MSTLYIIGELVSAELYENDDTSDIDGSVVLFSDQIKQKIYFNIQIPKGLMSIIMPEYWAEYVMIEVDNDVEMYLLKSIEYAEDEHKSGLYNKEEISKLLSQMEKSEEAQNATK